MSKLRSAGDLAQSGPAPLALRSRSLEWISQKAWQPVNLLLLLAGALTLPGITRGEFFYWRDEMHHAMDGVFFRDFLATLPLRHPMQFAYEYYAKYPAISVGHWPPLFGVIQGVFFLIFGLSPWVSRLAVLCFTLMAAYFWYRIAETLGPRYRALLSGVLLLSLPFLLTYERVTMLEVPALGMSMGAIYYWLKFRETEKRRYLLLLTAFVTAGLLISQLVIFLAFLIPMDLLIERRFHLLRRLDVWLSLAVACGLVLPWYYFTMRTLTYFMTRLTGTEYYTWAASLGGGQHPVATATIVTLLYYPAALYRQLGPLLLGLAAVGAVIALRRRTPVNRFMLIWIAAAYLCFMLLGEKDPRHTIPWLAALLYLALLALETILVSRPLAVAATIVLALTYAVNAVRLPRPVTGGMQQAAQFVMAQPESNVLYAEGPLAADFVFYVRKYDPLREHLVTREKQIVVSGLGFHPKVVLHDQDQIVTFFRTWGIRYAVIEDLDNVKGLDNMRSLLKTDNFKLVARFPIYSDQKDWMGDHVSVYRFQGELQPTHETVYVPMQSIAHDIPVDLSCLAGRPWP